MSDTGTGLGSLMQEHAARVADLIAAYEAAEVPYFAAVVPYFAAVAVTTPVPRFVASDSTSPPPDTDPDADME